MVGRFLSPDENIQMPDFTQNFNRYSYCLNNPFKLTDPTGEFFWIPVIIGAVIGGYSGYKIGEAHGAKGWSMLGYITGGAVIGGIAGKIGASVFTSELAAGSAAGYSGLSASFNAGMLTGMASGALSSGGFTALEGGNFMDIIGSITRGAVVGGFSGAVGATAFQGANNFFNNKWDGVLHSILPTNTLSYMAGSTTSQITANLVQGRNLFKNVDYGINLGMLLPLSVDIARSSKSFQLHMAKKNNTFSDREILSSNDYLSRTELMANGDLNLSISVDGQSQYPVYESTGFKDKLFSQIFSEYRHGHWYVNVNPFIRNYSSIIQTVYNLRITRK